MKNSKKTGLVFEKKSMTELQNDEVKSIEGGKYPSLFFLLGLEDKLEKLKYTQKQ